MADDRPAESDVEAIARISRELEDMRALLLVRAARCPTGTLEPTLLATPKPDTLFLDGTTKLRTAYPVLWQWAQDNAAVYTGGFTIGDGSTTFGLPNWQGRMMIGAGALAGDTYALGATGGTAKPTITVAQMPTHNHAVSAVHSSTHTHSFASMSTAGSHAHGGSGALADGTHSGHFPGSQVVAANGADWGVAPWNSGGSNNGNHNHSLSLSSDGGHTHTGSTGNDGSYNHNITESSMGSSSPIDVRPPFIVINMAIWT